MNAKNFFSEEALNRIKGTIRRSERNTSGEIRVHIANKTKGDVVNTAWQVFGKLNMHNTKHRNGVLIYFSVKDHKMAIVGDEGINQKTDDNFWDNELQKMIAKFKQEDYLNGVLECVEDVGEKLQAFFPKRNDDENELPNEVSFDE